MINNQLTLTQKCFQLPLELFTVNVNYLMLVNLVMWWHYWQGNVIHRSWVPVLDGHHCAVALGKLLTPVCLSPNSIICYQPRG